MLRETRALLSDPTRLTELAQSIQPDWPWSLPERTKLVRIAAEIGTSLAGDDPVVSRAVLLTFATRIEIASEAITIVLDPVGLMTALGFDGGACPSNISDAPRLSIPVALRRRGVETKLVLTSRTDSAPEPDHTLIRALARARRWLAELIEGVHPSVARLDEAHRTNERYVARHLQLACLSPSIVEAILAGRQLIMSETCQTKELTIWHLLNRIELPLDWADQARRLGCR